MSRIVAIDISHHRLPLDPPFPASWDPRPRTHFPATIVRVTDDDGRVGIGSGDAMYGFDDYRQHFLGQDPLDLARHHAVLVEHRVPRRPPLAARRRPLGPRRADPGAAGLAAARGSGTAGARLRVERRAPLGRRHGGGGRAGGGARLPGAEGALRASGADRRPRRGDARCAPRPATASSSWSTATRAGGCRGTRRRRGTSSGRRRWRRSWPPRTSTGWRSRSTAGTTPGTPSCGGGCRCGSPGAR